MKKSVLHCLLLLLLVLLSSCAGQYSRVLPSKVTYQSNYKGEDFSLSYEYDILQKRGYKRYSKKEHKKEIQLVSVKVSNHTDRTIKFGEDVRVYGAGGALDLMSSKEVYKSLRQPAPVYLLYLLLFPLRLEINTARRIDSYPVGLGIAPIIAGSNMGVAAISNNRLKKELKEENLLGREIGPGETVYGLVGLRLRSSFPLSLKRGE